MRPVAALLPIAGTLVALWYLQPDPVAREAGDAVGEPAPAGPGEIVVDYADDLPLAEAEAAEAAAGVDLEWTSEVSQDEALRSGAVPDVARALAVLRQDPRVEFAEPVRQVVALGYPDDPFWDRQWSFPAVGAAPGWRVGAGRGVVVAVIDTGVSPLPDLPASTLLSGRSFVRGSTTADDVGHGTHVAGTIAQATNNGVGCAGLAPNAKILPVKVLDATGGGRSDVIAAAIDWAADEGADVINLSLGGPHADVLVNAVQKARRAGVVVVAAAGNAGHEGLGSPADAPAALAVTALTPDGSLAPYSSWGRGVEIAAPGGDKRQEGGGILQGTVGADGSPEFLEFQGTSMAAPHVSAAAAVLLGAGARSAEDAERLLFATADHRDDRLRFGAGALDLGAAVRRLALARNGLQFLVGAVIAGALAAMAGRKVGFAAVVGGLIAGGLFFAPVLPLPPSRVLEVVARPLLDAVGPAWAGFPLWRSAALPALAVVLAGGSRLLAPLVLGLCGGIAADLLGGASLGADLWWLPFGLDRAWLSVNGTVALVAGLAAAGMARQAGTR
jgi:serine protease